MNKKQVLLDFLELTATIQSLGFELLQNKKYKDVSELFNDILNTLAQEEISVSVEPNRISGHVDKDRTMFEIGENQALMIFGEQRNENED